MEALRYNIDEGQGTGKCVVQAAVNPRKKNHTWLNTSYMEGTVRGRGQRDWRIREGAREREDGDTREIIKENREIKERESEEMWYLPHELQCKKYKKDMMYNFSCVGDPWDVIYFKCYARVKRLRKTCNQIGINTQCQSTALLNQNCRMHAFQSCYLIFSNGDQKDRCCEPTWRQVPLMIFPSSLNDWLYYAAAPHKQSIEWNLSWCTIGIW